MRAAAAYIWRHAAPPCAHRPTAGLPTGNQDRGRDGIDAIHEFQGGWTHPHLSGSAGGRDPARVLYEHAAGLLGTAHALEAATHASGATTVVAPTLACLETSLIALAGAV